MKYFNAKPENELFILEPIVINSTQVIYFLKIFDNTVNKLSTKRYLRSSV